ncbi:MAG: AAA domain-containing protein [Caldilineaceae bacterium SB0666_bin_21]|nr:AAA domain-containing protein [Caldilineaceae bacterium SB0666_bin_21]
MDKDTVPCSFCGQVPADASELTESLKSGVCICRECAFAIVQADHVNQAQKGLPVKTLPAQPEPVWPSSGQGLQPVRNPVALPGSGWEPVVNAEAARQPEAQEAKAAGHLPLPSPRDIVAYLDLHVVGQREAKKALAIAVHDHYMRLNKLADTGGSAKGETDPVLAKKNVLLLGPSGCGKTLLVKTIAHLLKVPFASVDATSLTPAGYFGEDVESMLSSLLHAADMDVGRAARGIIFIDEIDKARTKPMRWDVGGDGVQQALLKILEGATLRVSPDGSKITGKTKPIEVDTTHILFICGGVFDELTDVIAKRLGSRHRQIGFATGQGSREARNRSGRVLPIDEAEARHEAELQRTEDRNRDDGELRRQVIAEDFVKYGFMTEFMGRLPVHVSLEALDRRTLRAILTEPRNSVVRQAKWRFAQWGVDLKLTEGALDALAEKAFVSAAGARSLDAVLEALLRDLNFELPDREDVAQVVVNRSCVTRGHRPHMVPKA